ncbi:tRNA glutamyl-Q(34) synthetase GluQRS [Thalassotalea sp. 1_MG-2023]|uniref:tRNA glutamyl-Q(34) synthetase GluQRS n=1 Tax=Thalassotalea sp. 1_MG-2023 TaxID=3062680 RepID=UPI0026E13D65|nr:tRNA glutamyl-Q(34) synthetase GluQRS [Thalassotalea sp. 1_MG-2023]
MNNVSSTKRSMQYRGRFAPSPSGLLHYGSLITALASFLDAKHHQGQWLVRIEDIDPPREQAGASDIILETLLAFGLQWDEDVMFQSQQYSRYNQIISSLKLDSLAYHCQCTRAQIKSIGGIYQGHCRHLNLTEQQSAIRVINQPKIAQYDDIFQGSVICDKHLAAEDFIIKRRDGLYAYQLAVVADDIEQNITHVIRGCDLLEPTARQLSFFKILGKATPQYGHIPLAVTELGYKLSKQNKAPAIDRNDPGSSLINALLFLGQQPPALLQTADVKTIISWAIDNWQRKLVAKTREITI